MRLRCCCIFIVLQIAFGISSAGVHPDERYDSVFVEDSLAERATGDELGNATTVAEEVTTVVEITTEAMRVSEPAIVPACMARSSDRNGMPTPFNRIVGGSQVKRYEIPWQVSLTWKRYNGKRVHVCGGAVIAPYWVITAAHCTVEYSASELEIIAGAHKLTTREGDEQIRKPVKMFAHQSYSYRTQENDISLIRVNVPFVFNKAVKPVCLPKMGQTFKGPCIVSGWGKTKEGGRNSPFLSKVSVPIVTDKICRDAFRKHREKVTGNMLCAGYKAGKKDACQGDSGGPLVCPGPGDETVLSGIVSWGIGCARKNVYGVYTETAFYANWVDKIMKSYKKKNRGAEVDEGVEIEHPYEGVLLDDVDEEPSNKYKDFKVDGDRKVEGFENIWEPYIPEELNPIQPQETMKPANVVLEVPNQRPEVESSGYTLPVPKPIQYEILTPGYSDFSWGSPTQYSKPQVIYTFPATYNPVQPFFSTFFPSNKYPSASYSSYFSSDSDESSEESESYESYETKHSYESSSSSEED